MKKVLSLASLALLSTTGNVMAQCSDISLAALNNAVTTAVRAVPAP